MVKAFVFGKFMPFHRGHEAMIRYAISHCDLLSIVICCGDQEPLSGLVRKDWIEETFRGNNNCKVKLFNYSEKEFPNTSVSSREVSKVWAKKFKEMMPDYSLVITSEPYGDFVAEYMGIEHLPFDMEKKLYPISATLIRSNRNAYWLFLPNSVKAFYSKKVVLLGTESTGKTMLAKKLVTYFNATLVSEAGRDVIADSRKFTIEDLYLVIKEHTARIKSAVVGDSPLVIMDTNMYTTLAYAHHFFNKELSITKEESLFHEASVCLYLNNDVPFIQDGTRLLEEERDALEISNRKILEKFQLPYHEIKGSWEERFDAAVKIIKQAFA